MVQPSDNLLPSCHTISVTQTGRLLLGHPAELAQLWPVGLAAEGYTLALLARRADLLTALCEE